MTEARQALLTRIDSEVRAYRAALEAETRETCGELSAADALLLDAICDTERIRREAVAQIGCGKGTATAGRAWKGKTRRWARHTKQPRPWAS